MRTFAVLLVLAGLTGCNQKAPDSTAAPAADTKPEAATATTETPSAWNAADACSIVDKAAVAEILGQKAQTQTLQSNIEASNLWAFFQAKTIRRTVAETGCGLKRRLFR